MLRNDNIRTLTRLSKQFILSRNYSGSKIRQYGRSLGLYSTTTEFSRRLSGPVMHGLHIRDGHARNDSFRFQKLAYGCSTKSKNPLEKRDAKIP